MKQLLYIVAIVLFCSCKTGEFIEKELITFETGFPIQHNAYGIYYDSKTEQEYIYFGAYMDSAYVRFFTLDGKRTNKMPDIPLYQVTKNLVKVSTILVYDLDTVICIDKYEYNNKIVYINRKGEKYYTMNFDTIKGPQEDLYWILRASPNMANKPYIYLQSFYKWRLFDRDSIVIHNSKEKLTNNEIVKKSRVLLYKKYYEIPSVYKFNVSNQQYIYSDPKVYTYFTAVSSQDSVDENTANYAQSLDISYANKVFVWEYCSDKIVVLNPDNLQVEKCFQVDSKYTEIKYPVIPLKDTKFYEKLTQHSYENGRIENVLYDSKRERYYIVERHKIPMEDWAFVSESSFSIHVYDKRFKKLGEQYFEESKYDFRFMFLTSKGLYILQNENTNDYEYNKTKFYRFDIKK